MYRKPASQAEPEPDDPPGDHGLGMDNDLLRIVQSLRTDARDRGIMGLPFAIIAAFSAAISVGLGRSGLGMSIPMAIIAAAIFASARIAEYRMSSLANEIATEIESARSTMPIDCAKVQTLMDRVARIAAVRSDMRDRADRVRQRCLAIEALQRSPNAREFMKACARASERSTRLDADEFRNSMTASRPRATTKRS